mmetsp:Transcript_29353/g.48508  ORF Transcript_29353/g.48508 Transcript_29353/m.48508 type:complete len:206 (-) Transcript_29353:327-944(-)
MAHALPLAKLVSLFIKALSKPLAKRVKHQFSQYPIGQRIVKGIGEGTNQVTGRMTMLSLGYTFRSVTPLNDEKAMKAGADFIGEAVVVGVSAGIVIWEYDRSTQSNKRKEDKRRAATKAERDALQAKLVTLDVRLKALEEVVKGNRQTILGLGVGSKNYQEPANLVPIQDDDVSSSTTDTAATLGKQPHPMPAKKSGSWWNIFGL